MRIAFICLLFSFYFTQANAQQDSAALVLGEKKYLDSTVLEETREIWISTPYGYESSEEKYPVLIVLDGSSHFRHASTSAEHLARSNRIPGLIVVAVLNTDRGRDFTPPTDDQDDLVNFATHGGTDQFLKFLSDELLPYIEVNYRTRSHHILAGHSLGGLFATHAVLNKPEIFDAYIIMSPSLDWSNQGLVDQAAEVIPNTSELKLDIYLSVGNEGGEVLGAIRKITGILGEDTPRGLRWKFRHMPEENHNSMTLRSLYYGLESVFDGWSLPDYLPVYEIGGLAALEKVYVDGGRRFGYERQLPATVKLLLADDLIGLNRLEEAGTIILEELGMTPPSYFLNLLADKYQENGDTNRAIEIHEHALSLNPTDEKAKQRLTELGIDASELISVAEVDIEVLASYSGSYRPIPDFTMSIFIEDSKLYSRGTGQPATELVPLSETRFSVSGADAQIEFFKNSDGEASHLMLYQFGQEIRAPRIEE